ncbi:disintegrin and metalloproteinase domain-containing protein 10 [Plakobranchus ocellatus]|uniref:Disintegrin and metalloproteinase domain-containing protein 10 n=1 Tax=Plakobranchus ocellatus TaxID=259542 RepID=A0AAV4BD55_9GAST|nr:disintegrin and metalloproteinase domain-containing protein 10 [Plakobranchus ocellatus]
MFEDTAQGVTLKSRFRHGSEVMVMEFHTKGNVQCRWIHANFLLIPACQSYTYLVQQYSRGICDQKWTPAYAHDSTGYPVVGELNTLQEHILQGSKVHVQFSTPEWLITFPVDDFTFRGRTVCASTLYIFSDNGTHIETDADWLPTLVCTNGQVSRMNFTSAYWTRPVGTKNLQLDREIWWYTKPTQCDSKPVYSQFVDGSKSYGSMAKLLRMAKWSELRANMRDRGFSFLMQNQKIYDNKLVTAQSLNHVSLRYTQEAVKFNVDPYYSWLSVWSTNGRRDVSRWFLENTTLYRHNNDFVSLDWYGDQCWRRVYSTDGFGAASYGSLDELIQMVKLGHRVRVHFNGFNLKANGIRVVKDMVIAQTIEEYSRRDNYPEFEAPFFNTRARVVYRLVHSSGIVKTYKYFLDNFDLSEKDERSRFAVDWMVDTRPWLKVKTYKYFLDNFDLSEKDERSRFAVDWMVDTRPWLKVYRTDASGEVTFGFIRDLEDAVATGASVRLNIEQDELAGQFFTEADNVRTNFMDNQVYAQALKHVSDQKLQSNDEYIFQADIFRWSLMVSSEGVVAMNARRLASKRHLYDAISPATNVTWFINP